MRYTDVVLKRITITVSEEAARWARRNVDTNAVHVRLGPAGDVMLDSVIKGDTVREVLNYVQFSSDSLVAMLRRDVETALREGRLTYEESGALLKFYEEGLHGYTYLEDVHEQ